MRRKIMKSRLEEIKDNHEFRKGEGWELTTLTEDIDYLIEQAEHTQIAKEDVRIIEEKISNLYIEGARLRETLKFYADRESYTNGHHDLMGGLPSRVQMDEGELARDVLGLE